MNIREEISRRVSSFPTLPIMVNRLLYVLNDPESAAAEIARVIQYDPALTANILKAANSSFLGFSKPAGSIAEAAFRLGTNWIYQVAVSSLIYSNLKRPARGYELSDREFWRHSLATALMAEALRNILNIRDTGHVYTAGLVHDMGKIVLGDFVFENFAAMEKMAEHDKISFEKAEEAILGIDHAEIGALIAESWHFPNAIVECIRWHHNPDAAPNINPAIDLVHIADSICLMEGVGIGRDELKYSLNDNAVTRLNLNSNIIELASGQAFITLENVERLFEETPVSERGREVMK